MLLEISSQLSSKSLIQTLTSILTAGPRTFNQPVNSQKQIMRGVQKMSVLMLSLTLTTVNNGWKRQSWRYARWTKFQVAHLIWLLSHSVSTATQASVFVGMREAHLMVCQAATTSGYPFTVHRLPSTWRSRKEISVLLQANSMRNSTTLSSLAKDSIASMLFQELSTAFRKSSSTRWTSSVTQAALTNFST